MLTALKVWWHSKRLVSKDNHVREAAAVALAESAMRVSSGC